MSVRRAVDLVLVAVLGALGGLGFVAAFRLEDLGQPVVVGAVAGVGVSLVVTGLARRGASTTLLIAVPVLAAGAVAGCGIAPGDLVPGLRDGPRTILTSAVPAPDRPELLLVPYVAAALAAVLGAELAQRSRIAVAPALPPLAVFALGLAFGGEGRLPPLWIPAGWVVVAAVLTGWRAGGSDAEADVPVVRGAHSRSKGRGLRGPALPPVRAIAIVVLVAVPLAGCARWLGPRLPGADDRERFALRDHVDQPVQTQEVANPLVAVTAWQDGPDDPLFSAETSGRVDRWRLAVLDSYDGIEWRSAAGFVAAGPDLPGPLVDPSSSSSGSSGDGADEVSTQEVTETVEPTGLGGRWLPVVDRAVEVSAPDTLFDRAGGVLLVDGPELPARYTVRSAVPQPDPERLVGAGVADDEEARAASALPDGVPDDVRALADEIVQGTGSAYARAAAIERYLAASPTGLTYELATEELPSGHSVGHLRCFLFAAERCGRRGSTEQFVAAYALLARAAGLPTRVVVGFAASPSAGSSEVTAHDATAWAEVKLAEVGWVAFDPVPDPTVEITPPTTGVAGATAPPVPQPPTSIDTGADDGAAPEPDVPTSADDGGGGGLLVLVVGALVVLGALVAAFPALWRGRRRRRRRRAGSAAGRIAGAWAAAIDELAATGTGVTRAMAVADVVHRGRVQLGPAAEPLAPLGSLVNRTHFAAGTPADHDADQAWQLSDRFRTDRRKNRPLSRRLREYLILRSSA